MMEIGAMNKRIAFEKLNDGTEKWEPAFYECWAYVNGLSGSEYWAASAIQAENTVVFTVRYCKKLADISPQAFRIIFNGDVYDISHIDNIRFENEWLKIKAMKKY